MELNLSGVAVMVSITSLIWTAISARSQRQNTAVVTNHTNIIRVEAQIAKVPSLLRFHGIMDPEMELKQHGISAEEFVYLLNSFTVAGTFYRTAPRAKTKLLAKGSYRYNMCRSPATRRAWPLLRSFINKGPYRDHLDEIFSKLDKKLPLGIAAKPKGAISESLERLKKS